MIELGFLPGLALVHATATMSPGPNFAVVSKVASESSLSRRTLGVVLGVVTGISVHGALAGLGLTILLTSHDMLFTCVKALGAIYLFYMAVNSFRSFLKFSKERQKSLLQHAHLMNEIDAKADSNETFLSGYWTGLSTCILNPKAFLYFASIFPQSLRQDLTLTQASVTLLVLTCMTFVWFLFVAAFVSRLSIKHLQIFRILMSLVISVLFLSLAISIARQLIF